MQNWGKCCGFGHVYKYWLEHDEQVKKDNEKDVFSFCLPTLKYVQRVRFESPFSGMISTPKYKCPLRAEHFQK